MAEGDRAAVRVDPRVVVGDAEVVEEGQHLDGERLVDLEQPDVVDGQPGLAQRLLGGRDRADAHDLGLDAGEGVARPAASSAGRPSSRGDVLGGEQAARWRRR